jgi:ribosomal protein S18 acetylase RimI-like enzyme
MIRDLNEHDAETYWKFRLEALQQNPESFATSYEEAIARKNPIEQTANNLQSKHSFTFGFFKEENLVGVVTLLLENHLKLKHKAMIVAMFVSPNARKQGIARSLILEAIEFAKTKNIEQINLSVAATNHTAKKLYQSLNFRTYGIEENALKYKDEYWDDELMVLHLLK